jgi:hypothetical protein
MGIHPAFDSIRRTLNNYYALIWVFDWRVEAIKLRNGACTHEELCMSRALAILQKVEKICDCGNLSLEPDQADHIEMLAWEIGSSLHAAEISALAINPLVLFVQSCRH